MSEKDFQQQVTELAEVCGFQWVHFRPAQTNRGWRTPVQGPLGKGFPDLLMVHPRQQRILFAELKGRRGKTSPDQEWVMEILRQAGAEVYLWREGDSDDWRELVSVLNRREP